MSETIQKVVNPHMRVLILDEETTSIPRTLGITEEREKELDELTKTALIDEPTYTDTFAAISKQVNHANELAYCMFHVGSHAGRMKAQEAMGGLLEALVKSTGGSSKNSSEE